MAEIVIDTNVLLVANGAHEDVSHDCVAACISRLEAVRNEHRIVIDDAYQILGEYGNKLQANGSKGVGDAFLKWLFQNSSNSMKVVQVAITDAGGNFFSEFPEPPLQAAFDPADRKFVAVANAHAPKARIWQAADCKWLNWWQPLALHEVYVDFICGEDICEFYRAKFPTAPLPPLP